MPEKKKPLWKCPQCGHRFVTRNMWHSCSRYRLTDHFKGKTPFIRALFNRFRAVIQMCGPVTVYAQKTRIVFQTRARFAGCVTRKDWLDCGLWLKRRVEHPRFRKIESILDRDYIHHFRLTKLEDLDDEYLVAFIREAYAVGRQEPLPAPTENFRKNSKMG